MGNLVFGYDLVSACESYTELAAITAGLVLLWTLTFHPACVYLGKHIVKASWWPNAMTPMTTLMINFGFPKDPLPPQFPVGVDQLCCAQS